VLLAVAAVLAVVPVVAAWRPSRVLRLPAPWCGKWGTRWLLHGLLVAQPAVRSAARLYWNPRLGSRQGGSWGVWPSRSGPPWRGWERRVVRAFWSGEGAGREALLPMLLAACPGSSRVKPGDAWSDVDLCWQDRGGWEVRLISVTEFHRDGALTKVRVSVAALARVRVVAGAVLLLCGTAVLLPWPATVLLVSVCLAVAEWRHRAALCRAADDVGCAAAAAGLEPLHVNT